MTGSSNGFIILIKRLVRKAKREECQKSNTLMLSRVKTAESYQLEVRDIIRELKTHSELSKVDQKIFLELPNPKYREIRINLVT